MSLEDPVAYPIGPWAVAGDRKASSAEHMGHDEVVDIACFAVVNDRDKARVGGSKAHTLGAAAGCAWDLAAIHEVRSRMAADGRKAVDEGRGHILESPSDLALQQGSCSARGLSILGTCPSLVECVAAAGRS